LKKNSIISLFKKQEKNRTIQQFNTDHQTSINRLKALIQTSNNDNKEASSFKGERDSRISNNVVTDLESEDDCILIDKSYPVGSGVSSVALNNSTSSSTRGEDAEICELFAADDPNFILTQQNGGRTPDHGQLPTSFSAFRCPLCSRIISESARAQHEDYHHQFHSTTTERQRSQQKEKISKNKRKRGAEKNGNKKKRSSIDQFLTRS